MFVELLNRAECLLLPFESLWHVQHPAVLLTASCRRERQGAHVHVGCSAGCYTRDMLCVV